MSKKKKPTKRVAFAGMYDSNAKSLLTTEADAMPEERVTAFAAYILLLQSALFDQDGVFPLSNARIADAGRHLASRLCIGERLCDNAVRLLIKCGMIQKEGDRLTFPLADDHGKTLGASSLRARKCRREAKKKQTNNVIVQPAPPKPKASGQSASHKTSQTEPQSPRPAQTGTPKETVHLSESHQPVMKKTNVKTAEPPQTAATKPADTHQPAPKTAVPGLPETKKTSTPDAPGAQKDVKKALPESKPAATAPQKQPAAAPARPKTAPKPAATAPKLPPKPPSGGQNRPTATAKTAPKPGGPMQNRPRFTPMERPTRPASGRFGQGNTR